MPQTLAEKQAELAEIEAAISSILANGAEWKQGGREEKRADLATLYKRKAELCAEIDRVNRGGGIRVRQGIPIG